MQCRISTIINYFNLLLQLEVTITIKASGNHNQTKNFRAHMKKITRSTCLL